MPNTKTRTWFGGSVSGISRPTGFSSFTPYSDLGPQSVETRYSVNHARLAGGRWSGGGPFSLYRQTFTYLPNPAKYIAYFGTGTNVKMSGSVRLHAPSTSVPPLEVYSHPSDVQLIADGTSAIARTEPLNPAFDLSVFLGELRAEGIPNMPGSAVRDKVSVARATGSEYLNVEFGWLPLVRGIRDFASVVDQSDQILAQHRQNANRILDRSYEWPEQSDSRWDSCNHSVIPSAAGTALGGGQFQSVSQRKWFEAEYQFYLPTGTSYGDKLRRYGSYARKLLGVDLSPEVLWNLSPWSWAADWFGNVGDVMHNVSAFQRDGLVMRNAYIMCHTRKEVVNSGQLPNGPYLRKTEVEERKTRLPATPYGFGVSYDGLSLRQKAVVAALGLSRW